MAVDHAPTTTAPQRHRARSLWILGVALALIAVLCASYLTRAPLDRYVPRDDRLYRQIDPSLSSEQATATDFATLARGSSAVVVARITDVRHLETVQSDRTVDHYGLVITPSEILFGSTSAADAQLVVDVARADDDPMQTLAAWKAGLPRQPAIWFLTMSSGDTGERRYHLTAAQGLVVQGLTHATTPLGDPASSLTRGAAQYRRASDLAKEIDRIP